MSTRSKKYWIGTATAAVLILITAVLFLPGFGGKTPPPETIGGDIVRQGADFEAGDLNGTSVTASPISGNLVLSLQPTQSQGGFVSEPQQADYTFNALGLHWKADLPEGSRVDADVRFSPDGNSWGDWVKINIDDPDLPDHIDRTSSAGETIGQLAFADHARYFQYRLSLKANANGEAPAVTKLTASFIDAKGYNQSTLSLSNITRNVSAVLSPAQADAQPAIISRAQWGADDAYTLANWPPEYVPIKKIIVHHTVTSNSDPDPAATVRSIFYYHAVSLGWGDIGYNFLIDPQGRIYEGRYGGNSVVGGHALTWNYGSVGIAALGNYAEGDITPAMYSAFVELMAWKSNVNHVNPIGNDYLNGANLPNYLGHRDVGQTACPGDYLYARIAQFRIDAYNRYSPVPIEAPFADKWTDLAGQPGAALAEQYVIPGGKAQDFQVGRLIWKESTGQTYWVVGSILAKYNALGKWDGFMGFPTSDEYSTGGGRASDFDGGKIYWSAATDAHVVYGGILGKYVAEGGPSRLGFPWTDEYDAPGVTGGRESDFQWGRIYWEIGHGEHMIYGGILASYLQAGGPAVLDIPITDEIDIPGRPGGRENEFGGGSVIYWSAETGSHPMLTSFRARYDELGGPGGYFGLPTSDPYPAIGGQAQELQRALLTTGDGVGTHVVYGGVLSKYRQTGGPNGFMGIASSDEIDAPGVAGARESDFIGGRVYWSPQTGTTEVHGAILSNYVALGASAGLGIPTTDEYSIAGMVGGRESDFLWGRIYWSAGTGAHEVYGAIAAKWYEYGGPAGYLGMPLTGEIAAPGVAGARENDFEHGRIYWSQTTGARLVYGAILQAFLDYGGSASVLGVPTSDEYASGAGRRTDFQGGYIYWDAGTGAHVVVGPEATVTSDSAYEARDGNGVLLATLAAGQTASVSYAGGIYSFRAPGVSLTGNSYVRFAASGGVMQVTSYHDIPAWNPSLDDNRFRGAIEVRYSPVSDRVWVVNDLPLEQYLKGIAETSSGLDADFLKAMSVAARGYAYYHVSHGGKYGPSEVFQLKNSRNGNGDDQQYKGYGLEIRFPDLVTAVNDTAGQVVTYGGAPAITTYFSNDDGRTRSAQEAWGTSSWPWLASVNDPDDAGMAMAGHGVGLSGHGALARANRGDSYTTILGYYYSGTAVQTIDTSGNIRVAITSM